MKGANKNGNGLKNLEQPGLESYWRFMGIVDCGGSYGIWKVYSENLLKTSRKMLSKFFVFLF